MVTLQALRSLRNARAQAWTRFLNQSWDRAKMAAAYETASDAYETAARVWASRFR